MEYEATNIRLPKKTIEALRIKAAKERTSLAQLVRDAIEATYRIGMTSKGVDPQTDPFAKLIGSVKSGDPHGAENHDDIYLEDD